MERSLTVLIVDDSPEDRQVYRRYLQQDQEHTYTTLEAELGDEALELCQQYQPDGILLDFMLPDVDGLEFLAELKRQTRGYLPAIIMLTGYGSETIAVQAMKDGVQDYLVKGKTTPEHLCSTINSAIKNAQLSQELQKSEERFRTSVENMLDCFGIYSAIRNEKNEITDFRIDYVNAAACKFYQMTKEEQIGHKLGEVLPTYQNSNLFTKYCQVVEIEKPLIIEDQEYIYFDGHKQFSRYFDIHISKMGDGFVASWRDVTEQKQAENALRESEQLYRYLSNAIPQIVWIDNHQGECEYVNHRWEEYTGKISQQALGLGWTEIVHPDDLPCILEQWKSAINRGVLFEAEIRYRRFDGKYRWHLVRSLPIRDERENIIKWFGTATDIDDRKKFETERNQLLELEKTARAEAEKANQIKDDFVAMVSHDLRTPLNAILGWAKLLRTRSVDTDTLNRALETIERNAQAQGKLLEDLLNISRILRGKFQLELSTVNLVSIVKAAIETTYPLAEAKNISLKSIIDQSIPTMQGDTNRLLQVLGNLLSNAIKFTPSGGKVELHLSKVYNQQAEIAQITVSDTGLGISPEFLPYVFERYQQGDRTHRQSGLGLGLAIARHIVELHHGTIDAASSGLGLGATFTVKLPLNSSI